LRERRGPRGGAQGAFERAARAVRTVQHPTSLPSDVDWDNVRASMNDGFWHCASLGTAGAEPAHRDHKGRVDGRAVAGRGRSARDVTGPSGGLRPTLPPSRRRQTREARTLASVDVQRDRSRCGG
jgi:hypothetical protein